MLKMSKRQLLGASLLFAGSPTQLFAFDLGGAVRGAVNSVIDVGKATINVQTAPARAAAAVVQGRPVDQAVGIIPQAYGNQIQSVAGAAQTVDNAAYQAGAQAASQISPQARWVYDNTTVFTRIQGQIATTAAQAVGAVLLGQDPRLLGSAVLAAAIKQAIQQYQSSAMPLPADWARLLSVGFYPQQISSAQYVVDPSFTLTVPSVIFGFQTALGNGDFGVTIGNIIVFPRMPNIAMWDDFAWIAHETQHTVQYAYLGIDNFALQYCLNAGALENDANMKAMATVNNLRVAMNAQPFHY